MLVNKRFFDCQEMKKLLKYHQKEIKYNLFLINPISFVLYPWRDLWK